MLKKIISDNIKKYWVCSISTILKWKNNIKYLDELKKQTNFLPENSKISERIYCYLNNLRSILLCKECDINNVKFISINKWYQIYCSCKCSSLNDKKKDKSKQTNLLKYWFENPAQSDIIKEKIKKTNLKKYWFENVFQSDIIKEKSKQTNFKKYWTEYPSSSEIIKQKKENTFLINYWYKTPLLSPLIKEKSKQTNFKKYGVEYFNQSNHNKNKIKKDCFEKYWVEYFFQSDFFKEKSKQTNLLKYWSENAWILNKFNAIKKYQNLINKFNINIKIINNKDIYLKCDNCWHEWYVLNEDIYNRLIRYNMTPCYVCQPIKSQYSYIEKQFVEFVKTIYNWTIIENDRKILNGKEIDIFLPELNIWIEIHWLLWHSDKYKCNRYYHYEKYKYAKEKWIYLYQFFEDEISQWMMLFYSILKNKNILKYDINISELNKINEKYKLSIPINFKKDIFVPEELIITKIKIEDNNFNNKDMNDFLDRYDIKWNLLNEYIFEYQKIYNQIIKNNNLYNYWLYTTNHDLLSVISFKNIWINKFEIIRYQSLAWINIIGWLNAFILNFKNEIDKSYHNNLSLLKNEINYNYSKNKSGGKNKKKIEIIYKSDLKYEISYDFWINKELLDIWFVNKWYLDINYYYFFKWLKYKKNDKLISNIINNWNNTKDFKLNKIYNCWYIKHIL